MVGHTDAALVLTLHSLTALRIGFTEFSFFASYIMMNYSFHFLDWRHNLIISNLLLHLRSSKLCMKKLVRVFKYPVLDSKVKLVCFSTVKLELAE